MHINKYFLLTLFIPFSLFPCFRSTPNAGAVPHIHMEHFSIEVAPRQSAKLPLPSELSGEKERIELAHHILYYCITNTTYTHMAGSRELADGSFWKIILTKDKSPRIINSNIILLPVKK